MTQVRLGAVGYLNSRPLVYGLEGTRFSVRYDIPSRCAALLHEHQIDVGLIPSIEYLRGGPYRIVPDLAIASNGAVASVALYARKPISDVGAIAMDTSSRTSVALVRVLCAKLFKIRPAIEARGPDLSDMLERCDAALLIGDNALFLDDRPGIQKIDLGEAWLALTGLPFVYAFWAGRPGAVTPEDVAALQRARDEGVKRSEELARAYLPDAPDRQTLGARYLRDNIKYDLGPDARAGLEMFYRYAAELGLVDKALTPSFYDAR
jgi:chorismate dehydratase